MFEYIIEHCNNEDIVDSFSRNTTYTIKLENDTEMVVLSDFDGAVVNVKVDGNSFTYEQLDSNVQLFILKWMDIIDSSG